MLQNSLLRIHSRHYMQYNICLNLQTYQASSRSCQAPKWVCYLFPWQHRLHVLDVTLKRLEWKRADFQLWNRVLLNINLALCIRPLFMCPSYSKKVIFMSAESTEKSVNLELRKHFKM